MDRRDRLLRALAELHVLPERPPIIVVDNGSSDGSAEAVRAAFPDIAVLALERNHGACARNAGVALADTPYVAFADDDSWWMPGALHRAADLLDSDDRLAVIAGRILVGADRREDPVCAAMAGSPLPDDDLPGPAVLGFLAFAAVVRRRAFLDVGGFDDLLFFYAEEHLLALDLEVAGWRLAYAADVVAVHHPVPPGNLAARRQRARRNAVLASWLRRRPSTALRCTLRLAADAARDPAARAALAEVAVRAPATARRRRPLPRVVEARLRAVERARRGNRRAKR